MELAKALVGALFVAYGAPGGCHAVQAARAVAELYLAQELKSRYAEVREAAAVLMSKALTTTVCVKLAADTDTERKRLGQERACYSHCTRGARAAAACSSWSRALSWSR